jgi:hypothetical protein
MSLITFMKILKTLRRLIQTLFVHILLKYFELLEISNIHVSKATIILDEFKRWYYYVF